MTTGNLYYKAKSEDYEVDGWPPVEFPDWAHSLLRSRQRAPPWGLWRVSPGSITSPWRILTIMGIHSYNSLGSVHIFHFFKIVLFFLLSCHCYLYILILFKSVGYLSICLSIFWQGTISNFCQIQFTNYSFSCGLSFLCPIYETQCHKDFLSHFFL